MKKIGLHLLGVVLETMAIATALSAQSSEEPVPTFSLSIGRA